MTYFPVKTGEFQSPTLFLSERNQWIPVLRLLFVFFAEDLQRESFRGQYLKRAETATIAPMNPIPSQKIPEIKKDRVIRVPPKTEWEYWGG